MPGLQDKGSMSQAGMPIYSTQLEPAKLDLFPLSCYRDLATTNLPFSIF